LRHAGTGTTLPTSGTAALYYHRNQQYSIVGLSDAAGALVERYAYTAYGELTILAPDRTLRATSSFENRYTYTGREWDAGLSLYYFRARWLEPKAGRFIGRDPLGYVDGMGLYGAYFAIGDTDPSGTRSICCTFDDGSTVWNWTLNAKPGETAGERCSKRIQGMWGGWLSTWKLVSSLENPCDGNRPTTFYICGSKTGDSCADSNGILHWDIYSDPGGKIRVGLGARQGGSKEKPWLSPDSWCRELHQCNEKWDYIPYSTAKVPVKRKLTWGAKAGKFCSDATDSDITSCIQSRPKNDYGFPVLNNCQTDTTETASDCCLCGGGTGLSGNPLKWFRHVHDLPGIF
jgi:RHS repeat-associated protein